MDGSTQSDELALHQRFEQLRSGFTQQNAPVLSERRATLLRLRDALRQYQDEIITAVSDDFGYRAAHETKSSELVVAIAAIDHMRAKLRRWMAPKRQLHLTGSVPGWSSIWRQPKGVVGIISPWNYPVQLTLVPVATALAAGNAVMLKPSEFTPRTSALVEKILLQVTSPGQVEIVQGGAEVAAAFAALPFDHLFFTGSTAVGRKVAQAAAPNLTPITLELGGKSPCVMMPDADPARHATLTAFGRFFSAGQTCVAPDYLLVPEGREREWTDAILAEAKAMASRCAATTIISDRHFRRLQNTVDEAHRNGATVLQVGESDPESRAFAPTLILGAKPDSLAMREEIFGPILPIISYGSLNEAAVFINERDHPLAAYVMGPDVKRAKSFLQKTISGGAAINGTILQFAVEDLPVGGIGASGTGSYHGEHGFLTFSHERSVLTVPDWPVLRRAITDPTSRAFRFLLRRYLGR